MHLEKVPGEDQRNLVGSSAFVSNPDSAGPGRGAESSGRGGSGGKGRQKHLPLAVPGTGMDSLKPKSVFPPPTSPHTHPHLAQNSQSDSLHFNPPRSLRILWTMPASSCRSTMPVLPLMTSESSKSGAAPGARNSLLPQNCVRVGFLSFWGLIRVRVH